MGPARVLVDHRNVIDAAVRCGVEHVAYLSSLDADVDSPFCYAVTNATTEAMLVEAGLGCSIVRVSTFAEFFDRWPRLQPDVVSCAFPPVTDACPWSPATMSPEDAGCHT